MTAGDGFADTALGSSRRVQFAALQRQAAQARRVEVDGVPYVPAVSLPGAAGLMRALAEEFWGDGATEAGDPEECRHLFVLVTDDAGAGGTPLTEFTASLMRKQQ